MDEHHHLWVHRKTLGGTVIERCLGCRRARRPTLTSSQAQQNDVTGIGRLFRRAFAASIADAVRPMFSPSNGFGHG